jgi:16S rRNA (uracil1498-N3)-methyltransferase
VTPPVFVVPPADLAHAQVGGTVRISGAEGRHAVAVRRMTVGESLSLVDGEGRRVGAEVSAVVDRSSLDAMVTAVADEAPPTPRMVVVQALPKGERGELAVELMTEAGVDAIVPWAAANCVTQWKGERADRGHRRWVDAARAAGKQSRRTRFPVVEPIASTADVVARVADAALAVVLHEHATTPISEIRAPAGGDVVLVVGPEGGLTDEEVSRLAAAGAHPVRLGPSVMRTSSAGIAALCVLLAPTPRWAVVKG